MSNESIRYKIPRLRQSIKLLYMIYRTLCTAKVNNNNLSIDAVRLPNRRPLVSLELSSRTLERTSTLRAKSSCKVRYFTETFYAHSHVVVIRFLTNSRDMTTEWAWPPAMLGDVYASPSRSVPCLQVIRTFQLCFVARSWRRG